MTSYFFVLLVIWGFQSIPSFYQYLSTSGVSFIQNNSLTVATSYFMSMNGIITTTIRFIALRMSTVSVQ